MKGPEDISVELKGIAASLCVFSSAFAEEDGKFSEEIIADSLYSISLQIERISREVAELEFSNDRKNNLKNLRKLRGFEIQDLEELSGIPCETLRKIEHGEEVVLNTRSVAKLADILNVKASELFAV